MYRKLTILLLLLCSAIWAQTTPKNTLSQKFFNEDDLIIALSTNVIAGAGLDVYEHEPRVPAALTSMENVTLLPHLGTAALDVRTGMGMMALDNLIAFFDGNPVPNAI